MNPDENNLNTGAGTGPNPLAVDFTNPATSNPNPAGLSMADSLASAEDNLTAAGMAAKDPASNMMGLDQISSADPTAAMARPEEPLVPAAPVPGSIGSAVSGAAANPAATPVSAGSSAPVAPVLPEVGGGNMANEEAPAQAPFNPFANNAQQVRTPAMQPAVGGGAKKPKSLLTIILAGLAILAIVAAVIFAILWQQAANAPLKVVSENPGQSSQDEPAKQPSQSGGSTSNGSVVCARSVSAEEADMEGVMSGRETVTLGFKNDVVKTVSTAMEATFADEASAEEVMPMLQMSIGMAAAMMGADAGDGAVREGNVVRYSLAIDLDSLLQSSQTDDEGWGMSSSMSIGQIEIEDGQIVNAGRAELVSDFENAGYTCTAR